MSQGGYERKTERGFYLPAGARGLVLLFMWGLVLPLFGAGTSEALEQTIENAWFYT